MKFLVDAQLPRRLANRLGERDFDVLHTLELRLANRTPDADINEISMREKRIVITKDADFVNSFTIHGKPYKLLLVSTGNIKNTEMMVLFDSNMEKIVEAFDKYKFIEIDRDSLVIHQ